MDAQSAIDLEPALANFHAAVSSPSGEALLPRDWSDADWRELFRYASLRRVKAGEALIRIGEHETTFYFVLRGDLEVVIQSSDGISMGPLARIGAGSVLGEQSFFDGKPRSASVWAVRDCEVAAMAPEQYQALVEANPTLARALLFALGRILAIRLRQTTAKVAR